jgi:hypothetical protein
VECPIDHQGAVIYQFAVAANKSHSAQRIESAATEDTGALPSVDAGGAEKAPSRRFLGAGRQNLAPEDFKNPAVAPVVARFLLDDCEKLDQEKAELRVELRASKRLSDELRAENNEHRITISDLSAKTKGLTINELLYFICSASGAAGFPVMLGVESIKGNEQLGVVGMVICGILVLGSIRNYVGVSPVDYGGIR